MEKIVIDRDKSISQQIEDFILEKKLFNLKELVIRVYIKKEIKNEVSRVLNSKLSEAKVKIYLDDSHKPFLIFETLNEILEENSVLKQYREAVESSYIVSRTDLNGNITYANEGFLKISGYSYDELVGKPHSIVRHEEMPKYVYEKMWQKIKIEKSIWRGVIKNKKKDGSVYWVDSTIRPILDIDGNIIEYIAFRQDITKIILKEEHLKEEKEFTRNILDSQDNILILSDPKSGLVDVNDKFFEYLDFNSLEEFKKKFDCVGDIFIPEKELAYNCYNGENWLKNIYHNKNSLHKTKLVNSKGEVKFFSIKIDKIKISKYRYKIYGLNQDTNSFLYLITLNDITELELALQKTKEAVDAKSRFLANMSHEIRTPMNGILGFAELLQKTELDNKQRKYIKTILNSGETLLGIINDILDFSKIESGKMNLEYIKFNPIQEFEPTLELFNAKMLEKQINYLIFIDPNLPLWIESDSLRIKQALSNLIGNAIKFTSKWGEITIRIESKRVNSDEVDLTFSVQDTGIGISKEQQKKIFTPFTQADDSTTRRFGGTGLGLSITKSFIELMGSSLELDSKLGKGSKFYFTIRVKSSKDIALDITLNDKMAIFIPNNESKRITSEIQLLKEYLKSFKLDISIVFDINELSNYQVIWIITHNIKLNNICEICSMYKNTPVIIVNNSSYIDESTLKIYSNLHFIQSPISALNIYDSLMELLNNDQEENNENNQDEVMTFSGSNVLVAEDNSVNQMLIDLLLKEYDIYPDMANNGQEAVEFSKEKHYDLILMDINMPVLGGLEAMQIIKNTQNNLNNKTPIVALTANAMSGDRERFLEAKMSDYLTKPVIIPEFERVLKTFLKSSTLIGKELKKFKGEIKMIELPKGDFSDISVELISKELGLPPMFIGKLIDKFVETIDENFQSVHQSILNRNSEAIRNSAHKIKGSSANLRFFKLTEIMKTIELNGKDEVLDGYDDLLKEAEIEIQKIKDFAKTL